MNGLFHHVLLHPHRRRANRRRKIERLAKAGVAGAASGRKLAQASRGLVEATRETSAVLEEAIRADQKAAKTRRRRNRNGNHKNRTRRR